MDSSAASSSEFVHMLQYIVNSFLEAREIVRYVCGARVGNWK